MKKGKLIGFFLGAGLFILTCLIAFILESNDTFPSGLNKQGVHVIAVTLLMAVWWITEAIPIPATALLPIALFPALGIMKVPDTTAQFGNHLIYLFMGGFFLAVTMERWNLHKRIALFTIKTVGSSPSMMILGFMISTAFLSMWVSNTATAMMMVPIGLAVVTQATGRSANDFINNPDTKTPDYNFGRGLMLAIAYAASIGGVGTIIGTPPNVVMVGMVDKMYGQTISFGQWMMFGIPLVIIMLAVTWYILTKVLFNTKGLKLGGSEEIVKKELEALGPMTKEESWVIAIVCMVAVAWISRGFLVKIELFKAAFGWINDSAIAIFGSVLLFIIPSSVSKGKFLLDWKTAVKIPWNVVLLFGGGLALAEGFKVSGLATWLASLLSGLQGIDLIVLVFAVVMMVIFLTEITSNTATATLLVPIMGSAAVAMNVHPYGPIIGACVAASMAFMLPVATPPNAVVFGSECITIKQMAKSGLLINIIGAVIITVGITYLIPILWGIDLTVVPAWAVK